MDSTAIRKPSRRSRAVQSSACKGAIEALERRVLLSGSLTRSVDSFIANYGQWADPDIHYALPNPTGNIFITDSGPIFQLFHTQPDGTTYSEALSVTFDGSNTVRPTGVVKGTGVHNFYLGDESTWRQNVPGYDQIAYKGIYDGVDLFAWGRGRGLKYEFHVAPGVDWQQVQISYSGIQGLSIDAQGHLHIQSHWGEVIDDAPLVYQVIKGKQVVIPSSFRLVDNDTYTFELHGEYDPRYELILDPEIDWSTYLGAENEDHVNAVATDSAGGEIVAYVTGYTENGLNFPLLDGLFPYISPLRPYTANDDVFVTKFDSSGQLVWNTFLGGFDDDDQGNDIVVDNVGRVIVVGTTSSSDFATTVGAEDRVVNASANDNDTDAFVARFTASGTLQYSSFLGNVAGLITGANPSNGDEEGLGVDVDEDGFVYVVGQTASDVFATIMPDFITTTIRRADDGFVAKMNLDVFPQTIWRRFLGGSANETLNDIDVNPANGDIYVVGNSNSPTAAGVNNVNPPILPGFSSTGHLTVNAYQVEYGGGNNDAYLARLNTNGALQWGTYLGGTGADIGNAIAVNPEINELAVTGQTGSGNFNIFPRRTNPNIPTDSPIINPFNDLNPFENTLQGTNDAFIGRFVALTGGPKMISFFGGTGNGDEGTAVAYKIVGGAFSLLVAGNTNSPNFPIVDFQGVQDLIKGGTEAFLLSLTVNAVQTSTINYSVPFGGSGNDEATGLTVDVAGGIWMVGFTNSPFDPAVLTSFNLNGIYRTDGGTSLPALFDVLGGEDDGFIAHFSDDPAAAPVVAPSNVRALALSMTSVRVTWVDNSSNELGFIIRRKTGPGGAYSTAGTVGQNVRTFEDTGLLPDTTYYYFVYAFNLTGRSEPSNVTRVTTRPAAVAAPNALIATTISYNRIDLFWNDNADNEADFEIYRAETAVGLFVLIDTIGANLTSYQDTSGLDPGTQYTYRIRATNAFRASNFSNDATATTQGASFLIPPSDLSGIPLSPTSVRLVWTDNSDNELGFSIERSVFGTGIFNEIGTTGAGETFFIDPLVSPGTIYTYRVRAFNEFAFSGYSNTTNSDPGSALATPALVEARATSSSSILVTWFDKAVVETGYVIERAVGQPSDFNVIFTTGPNVTSFTDNNLLPRTRYYYRISATDGNVSSPTSPVASATTLANGFLPPPTPTVIRGKALSFTSIRVTWRDNSSTETAFSIERADVLDGPYATIGTVPANSQSFDDVGPLRDGTVYYYRVVARQGTIESLPSTIIKVRTIVRPRLVVNATDASGAEPNNPLVFNIRRKDTFDGDLVVVYSLSGTATNNVDYNRLSGQVVIPEGQPTVDVVVVPKDDSVVEGNETVTLTLVNNSQYKVSPSLRSATGTIADNDGVAPAARASGSTSSMGGGLNSIFSRKSISALKLLGDLL